MKDKPVVYFGSVRSSAPKAEESIAGKYVEVIDKLGIKDGVKKKKVAIKMHVGNNVGFTTVNPFLVHLLVNTVKEGGGQPFIIDIIENYSNPVVRGYTHQTVGCPVLPVAGIADSYYLEKKVNYKGLDTIQMGGHVRDADVLIDLSHVKGHNSCGFGGAIKNLALGCYTQKTRWGMHRTMQHDSYWNQRKCKNPQRLVEACPHNVIKYNEEKKELKIIFDECNQCRRCLEADTEGCLQIHPRNFQAFPEIMAIATKNLLDHFAPEDVYFINVATDITEYCDCWGFTTGNILPDLGVLGSKDILAIDKATLDLLKDQPLLTENISTSLEVIDDPDGKLHPFQRYIGPYKNPYNQIHFGAKYDLGDPEYALQEVRPPKPRRFSPPNFPPPAKLE